MKKMLFTLSLLGLLSTAPVFAQTRQFNVGIARVNAGLSIPIAPSDDQGTLYLEPGRSQPGVLAIADDIYDANGNLAIPEGSEVRGNFQPVKGGLRFVADAVIIRGRPYPIRAISKTIRDQKDPREYSGGALAGDAAIGAGGGALLGALTGGVNLGTVLGGLAAGVAVGNITAPQVVVIDQNNPVTLKLQTSLAVRN
jgi:hypothetical protein